MTDRGLALVIADSEALRNVLVREVERLGYATLAVERPAQVFRRLPRQPFTAVLASLDTRSLDGLGALARVREITHGRHARLLIVTTAAGARLDRLRDMTQLLRVDAFLSRPLDVTALQAALPARRAEPERPWRSSGQRGPAATSVPSSRAGPRGGRNGRSPNRDEPGATRARPATRRGPDPRRPRAPEPAQGANPLMEAVERRLARMARQTPHQMLDLRPDAGAVAARQQLARLLAEFQPSRVKPRNPAERTTIRRLHEALDAAYRAIAVPSAPPARSPARPAPPPQPTRRRHGAQAAGGDRGANGRSPSKAKVSRPARRFQPRDIPTVGGPPPPPAQPPAEEHDWDQGGIDRREKWERLADQARLEAVARRYDAAVSTIEAAMALSPDRPMLHYRYNLYRGWLAKQRDDIKHARRYLAVAVRLAPPGNTTARDELRELDALEEPSGLIDRLLGRKR